jgi:cysteinyl-tRNA synthetase, unknown class
MKKLLFLAGLVLLVSCKKEEDDSNPLPSGMDYKQEMRNLVIAISQYGKGIKPGFIIIPQNGQEIVTKNGGQGDEPATSYLQAIDGVGREDLFFGYGADNQATPAERSTYLISYLDICREAGVQVLVTDYCSDHTKMDESYSLNSAKDYISFAAPVRELNTIPDYPAQPYHSNTQTINSLSLAKNFLYLINPEKFDSKQSFINAVAQTNYDVVIMDMFFAETAFTKSEIDQLKTKKNGGSRLIISYMSIGEAESYRYYWNSDWSSDKPKWLDAENPEWKGNYKVRYWDEEWKSIIYGNNNSYLKKILDAGFDGVYLDIIDAFEYFEDMTTE